MIQAEKLTKHFGDFVAVEDVSFRVPKGQVAAFLGPNGAGKTTTMRLLTGYLAPTSGTAKICGLDIFTDKLEVLQHVGYLPENGPLYNEMTPREILKFFGSARGLSNAKLKDRIEDLIGLCALGEILDKPVFKLSRGNRQRVGMAQALLHEPEVLILDEPTAGLDPNQIRAVRQMIRALAKDRAILLSTHILQEVEAVADRVIFISDGRIVFDGTPAEMRQKGPSLDDVFQQLTNPVSA